MKSNIGAVCHFVMGIILIFAGSVPSVGQDIIDAAGKESALKYMSDAYQLGTEQTGALVVLFKLLPNAIEKTQREAGSIGTVISDFSSLGKIINEVKSTADYKALLGHPIALKYGLSSAFPAWDPYLQAVTVDNPERSLEDGISGAHSALRELIRAEKKAGTNTDLSGAFDQLRTSLLHVPDKFTVEGFKQDPLLGRDPVFTRIAEKVAAGEDPVSILKGEANSAVQRGMGLLEAKTREIVGKQGASIIDFALSRSKNEFSLTKKISVESNAAALIAFAELTGNRDVIESVDRAAKVARSAAEAYRAMQLVTSATTGMGMFVAFSTVLSGVSSLNGTQQSEGEQTLALIQKLFEYLKLQFAVINSKLDSMMRSLDRIEGKIDRIGEALADVIRQVRSIDGRLEQLKRTVEKGDLQLARAIWDSSLSDCEGMVKAKVFELRQTFVGCINKFITFGNWASRSPFIIENKDNKDQAELAKLLDESEADAVAYSRYSPLIPAKMSKIFNLPPELAKFAVRDYERFECPALFANAAVIWRAAQYLTAMAQQNADWFVSEGPLLASIEKLRDQARAAERQTECLKGKSSHTLGERLKSLLENYEKALEKVADHVEELNHRAAARFVNDILAATKETVPDYKLAPWSGAIPPSDPRVRPLKYCEGEKPPRGEILEHEFGQELVAKLPKFFSKSYEISFARIPGSNEKLSTMYLCVQDDKTEIFQAHYPGGSYDAIAIDAKLQFMVGKYPVRSVRIPKTGGGGPRNCTNAIECINKSPKLRNAVYDAVNRLFDPKEEGGASFAANMIDVLQSAARVSPDREVREKYAEYFQAYVVADSDNQAFLANDLDELDNNLALLKYFAVMALPKWWATEDAWRLLLDGNAGAALFGKKSF